MKHRFIRFTAAAMACLTLTACGTGARVTERFSNKDGSADFRMVLETRQTLGNPRAVEVEPYYLTAEDARCLARTLFGDADYQEAEPIQIKRYSKSEIQAMLDRWTRYGTKEALTELYGAPPTDACMEDVKRQLAQYGERLETAEENPHEPCRWTYRKYMDYHYSQEMISKMNREKDFDELAAQLTVGEIPYRFEVYKNDTLAESQSDVCMALVRLPVMDGPSILPENAISGSGENLNHRYFVAGLCRTPLPTDEQLTARQQKAEQILQALNLGPWQLDRLYIETRTYGETPEYTVHIGASPVVDGMPAVHQKPQFSPPAKDDGDTYQSDWEQTSADFGFSADGRLTAFTLISPLTEKTTRPLEVLPEEELLEKAKEALKNTKEFAEPYRAKAWEPSLGNWEVAADSEAVNTTVTATALEYRMARTDSAGKDVYAYTPCLVLRGTVRCVGKDTGTVYYESKMPETLVAVDAVTGDIIRTVNTTQFRTNPQGE
mgnify:CR=1 FL=1